MEFDSSMPKQRPKAYTLRLTDAEYAALEKVRHEVGTSYSYSIHAALKAWMEKRKGEA